MDMLGPLHDTLKPFYSYLLLAFTWIGLGIAWWRRRSAWRRREYLDRVNFSVNTFTDSLNMRTVLEVDSASVWPNAYGLKLLRKAAEATTNENPFMRLADADDRDYVHRAVKNAVSQLCPTAFVAAALGVPVKTGVFRFAVTCERYEEGMRTIKLRVLLVEQTTLREVCGPGGPADRMNITGFHLARLRTLQAMHEMDRKAQAGGPDELGRVELGVPVGSAGS